MKNFFIRTLLLFLVFIFVFQTNISVIAQQVQNNLTQQEVMTNKPVTYMANLVVFVYFEDVNQERLDHFYLKSTADELIDMYNGDDVIDFKGYMNEISYGQLQVHSIFPQLQEDGTFSALALPYKKTDTKNKHMDADIIRYISNNIGPTTEDLDLNDDGVIDSFNVVYIDEASSLTEYPTVWPHQHTNKNTDLTYNGLGIRGTHVENTDKLYYMPGIFSLYDRAGLIAHEFLHLIGYPDLYDGYGNHGGYTPVGGVDIMAVQSTYLQWPLAYMRQHFSNWVKLPEITSSTQNVTVHLQSNKEGTQGVIIKSPLNNYEFFVVEFRQDTDRNARPLQLDSNLYDSGLLIYRIDTNVTNLSNFFGQTGVYVFRNPQKETYNILLDMFFSGDEDTHEGQKALGSRDLGHGINDGAITFTDGTNSGIIIDNISVSTGEYMTFDVTVPDENSLDLWDDTGYIGTATNSYAKTSTSMTEFNDKLYSITAVNNNSGGELINHLNLFEYQNSTWRRVSGVDVANIETNSGVELFVFDNELYVAFAGLVGDYYTTYIKKYDFTSNKWIDVGEVSDENASGGFDITSSDREIYVAYVKGVYNEKQSLKVQSIINPISNVVIDDAGSAGQPTVAVAGGKVYAGVANGTTVNVKEVFSTTEQPIVSYTVKQSFGLSYDLVGHEGELFMVVEDNGSIKINILLNNSWSLQAQESGDFFDPKIQSSQGNLYVLAGPSSGDGATNVYRFINDENIDASLRLEKEGGTVDIKSSQPTIVSIAGNLYVCYVRTKDGATLVKEKLTSNQLLAISINSLPLKTEYIQGENTDVSGLTINANYEKEVRFVDSEFTVSGFDTTQQGERYATVSYEGKVTTFPYLVLSETTPEEESTTITGSITSYNNGANTTLCLYDVSDVAHSNVLNKATIAYGVENGLIKQSFVFKNVKAGNYTLVISKPAHVDYIIKNITIGNTPLNLDDSDNLKISNITLMHGDVNADNIINFLDLSIVRNTRNYNLNTDKADVEIADINNDKLIDKLDYFEIINSGYFNLSVSDSMVQYS